MINVVHAFSGVDSQYMAEKRVFGKNNINIICTMEVDVDAIISCALIHEKETFDIFYNQEWNQQDYEFVKIFLKERNIGFDFENNKSKIDKMKKDKLKQLYIASVITKNYGDISLSNKIKFNENIDLFTYSFPCTDISIAGKQEGLSKGSGTRSGLLWECEQFIINNKPKILLMENVKNLVGKKFINEFNSWLNVLNNLGYKSYWKVLNAKDFGVPQNRERVFCVSIRNDINKEYIFPENIKLNKTIKDILENNVDEKYYYNNEKSQQLMKLILEKYGEKEIIPCDSSINKPKELEVDNCITARYDAGIQNQRSVGVAVVEKQDDVINPLKGLTDYGWHFEQNVYDVNGVSRTLKAGGGSGNIPKIIQKVGDMGTNNYSMKDISFTIPANPMSDRGQLLLEPNGKNYRIRKLTPRECWRLMDFDDYAFDNVNGIISNSSLYKQAGNSIVVACLEYIFKNLKEII